MNALDEFLDRHRVAAHRSKRAACILYGDSLAFQARDLQAALVHAGITQVTTRTYGGTAICDWFDQMRADAATIRPDAVVIEFSGNALTTCMKALDGSPLSGDAYFQKYAEDASTVVSIFAPGETRVLLRRRRRSAAAPNSPRIRRPINCTPLTRRWPPRLVLGATSTSAPS